ncbi:MAG TPA: DJ-1/PfpI family protein [Candidatus Rubrimentiphilum sp.]|nr:DJ-1/PfpI family protein [Candidatus Rubrimentiphilum sp.]
MQRKHALVTIAGLAGGLAASSAMPAVAASVPNLGKPLTPPAQGQIRVGFVIGPGLVAIDWIGPWQTFGDAYLGTVMDMSGPPLFNYYAMTPTGEPTTMDGVSIGPQYSFANAPLPHVLVVPGQRGSAETVAYIKEVGPRADVTMSVCTGAFLVARAGLFDGLNATTHHTAYDEFEKAFPRVTLIRGAKFVENANVSASGGESSGIDLALRVIERYYGSQASRNAAYNMEYRRTARPQNINDV